MFQADLCSRECARTPRLGCYQPAPHPLQCLLNRHQNPQGASSTELLGAFLSQTSAPSNTSISHLRSTYSSSSGEQSPLAGWQQGDRPTAQFHTVPEPAPGLPLSQHGTSEQQEDETPAAGRPLPWKRTSKKSQVKSRQTRQGAAFAQGLARQLLCEPPAWLASPHSFFCPARACSRSTALLPTHFANGHNHFGSSAASSPRAVRLIRALLGQPQPPRAPPCTPTRPHWPPSTQLQGGQSPSRHPEGRLCDPRWLGPSSLRSAAKTKK